MSQSGPLSGAGGTPSSSTKFFTDDGNFATPSGGVLDVFSGSMSSNSNNGLQTSSSSNVVQISLTNRLLNSGVTVNGGTDNLITFPMGAFPANYIFQFFVVGDDTTHNYAVCYQVLGFAQTTGASASVLGNPQVYGNTSPLLSAASVTLVASGNNIILQVTGVIGYTISWKAVATYVVN